MSLKKQIASALGNTPLWHLAEMFHKRPRVLFYHGVNDKPCIDNRVQANQIPLIEFEKQMLFLKKNFDFISIDEFYQKLKEGTKFSGREIVLTFDDGYKNNFTVVAPLLQSLSIPFTIFISTNCVENRLRVPTYYIRSALFNKSIKQLDVPSMSNNFILDNEYNRMLCHHQIISKVKTSHIQVVRNIISEIEDNLNSEQRMEMDEIFSSEEILNWNEVKALSEMGVTIASHTSDHAVLHANQDEQTIRNQLDESKNLIESNIGICDYFAFPNGDSKSVCPLSVKLAGEFYKMSFAVDGKYVGTTYNSNFVSRIGVCEDFGAARSQVSVLPLGYAK